MHISNLILCQMKLYEVGHCYHSGGHAYSGTKQSEFPTTRIVILLSKFHLPSVCY